MQKIRKILLYVSEKVALPTNQPTNQPLPTTLILQDLADASSKKSYFNNVCNIYAAKKEVKRRKISFKWNSILLKKHAPETCGCKNEKSHPVQFTYYSEYS